jgi:tetratricopeptide (TPR) repeat protein
LVDDLADAALEAEVGRPDRARALVQRYDAAPLDTVQRRLGESPRHLALGWIAIAEGRGLDAARELRESDQLRDGPNGNCYMCIDPAVGIAFDRANLPDSAIATFEHFLKSPYYARHNVDAQNLAWVLRRLGELYEAKGDAAKARGYYQRFVDLWKGADVELQPQVAAVQSRLKRLDEVERRSR